MIRRALIVGMIVAAGVASGCAQHDASQRIIFLDGAGNYGAHLGVEHGLRTAGYQGEFEDFVWTSGLLWGVDHLVAARSEATAERLAKEITQFRRAQPKGYISLMGLSAGTSVVVSALEKLPSGVTVNEVVLFQPSISSGRNLAPALANVTGKLWATCSPTDAILATLAVNADGLPGTPAGRSGFAVPRGLPPEQRHAYARVVNLPWREKYRRYGWAGGHLSATSAGFVRNVIAPRILPRKSKSAITPQPASGPPEPEHQILMARR